MKSTLRILLVEASPADAELLLAALEEEGIAFDLTPFGSTRKLNSLAP